MKNTIRLALLLLIMAIASKSRADDMYRGELVPLMKELSRSKEDTNKVLLYYKIGNLYEKNTPDSAGHYYNLAGKLSEKLHYDTGIFKYYSNYSAVLNLQNKYEEGLALNLKSIELAQKMQDQRRLYIAYNNTGASYYGLRMFDKSTDYFLKCALIIESMGNFKDAGIIYANIAGLYSEMDQQPEKGIEYGLKGIKYSRQSKDSITLESALTNTGGVLGTMKRFDEAFKLYQESYLIAKKINDKYSQMTNLINLNYIRARKHQFTLLKEDAEKSLALGLELGENEGVATSYLALSKYYFNTGNMQLTKVYLDKCIAVAQKDHLNKPLNGAYVALSYYELKRGNLEGLYKNREIADSISDIELSEHIENNTQQAEVKYSLGKKQFEIENLNKEKQSQARILKQREIINWSLAGVIIITLLTGFLLFRTASQKRKLLLAEAALKEQKLRELETEKQLLITQSELKGQEEERKRLAKDLHDGLGGILSSTKYSFSNMKNNLIISEETASAFEHSMGMLDKSIQELRRVAHNMMPEALIKFGLNTALDDFCNNISQSGALAINYQSFNLLDEAIPSSKANIIYRIIQELVNNVLKHAAAKTILVQLVKNDDTLSISVEDDGKGFDVEHLKHSTGIGYLNLQNRVAFLKATMDIQSETGKGTSVNIEIPGISHD